MFIDLLCYKFFYDVRKAFYLQHAASPLVAMSVSYGYRADPLCYSERQYVCSVSFDFSEVTLQALLICTTSKLLQCTKHT